MTPATPSQTAGPFVALGTAWLAGAPFGGAAQPGAVRIRGHVTDGAGEPVTDAMLEFWQADERGRFPPECGPGWTGFGRTLSDGTGAFEYLTRKPGAVPAGRGVQAPHIDVAVFARGLLRQVTTRCYFPDEAEAIASDPFLATIGDPAARSTMVAVAEPGGLRFDIRLQGDGETTFFAF